LEDLSFQTPSINFMTLLIRLINQKARIEIKLILISESAITQRIQFL